jgi:ferrous iron transport protein B
MHLSDLNTGESAIIKKVKGIGSFRRRIQEMGFVAGKKVEVIKNAPLQDPVEYRIMGYNVSLRKSEASLIEVSEGKNRNDNACGCLRGKIIGTETPPSCPVNGKCKNITVALVGNPNSGKTTLFNYISGLRERVGNYSGVTVGEKTAEVTFGDYTITVTDLPGTYSLTAYSDDEKIVHDFIINETPDIIVNVIDSNSLERNLFLTTQLIDMDLKIIVALNMYDELERSGSVFDYENLARMTGIPFVPTVAAKNIGIDKLLERIVKFYNDEEPDFRHIHINYGHPLENSIEELRKVLLKDPSSELTRKISPRYIALKLIESDPDMIGRINKTLSNRDEILSVVKDQFAVIKEHYEDPPESLVTDAKYGFIEGALRETLKVNNSGASNLKSRRIDEFATHRIWGIPIFLSLMWLMFEATFTLGSYPMALIELGVEVFSGRIDLILSDGILKDMILDGAIGGVGGVLVFLPNILILFFFISFFEDTGYMSRVVFIVDKVMHKIGLHGRSFIPMLIGFGCSVPAIMATRTINSRKNRMVTMLVIPFMSCGAKLPVYILIIGAFFPDDPALVLFAVYGIGVFIAMTSSLLLKKTLFRGEDAPFVMELPPYRIPTFRSTVFHMWDKAWLYLKKMGGIILAASIVVWALGYFPRPEESIGETRDSALENSYIGRMGKLAEPVFDPIGFDWKTNVAVISGVAGKEIVVSTLSVLHAADEGKDLSEKLKNSGSFGTGENSRLRAFVFLLFILLYVPCIATITAIKNESGKWKWAVFSLFFTTSAAWLVSFIVYNIGKIL